MLTAKSYKPKANLGFTLTELLIVVGIIATLASITGIAGLTVIRRAQAAKIVSDFKKIEGAWQLWRTDTHLRYPLEDPGAPAETTGYIEGVPGVNCSDEVLMGTTDIYQNHSQTANYNGPYLTSVLNDPLNIDRQYTYDNDGIADVYDPVTGANYTGGVNIMLQWCANLEDSYWQLRNIIDRSIDGTDGDIGGGNGLITGKFRATAANGDFFYLLQADPNQ